MNESNASAAMAKHKSTMVIDGFVSTKSLNIREEMVLMWKHICYIQNYTCRLQIIRDTVCQNHANIFRLMTHFGSAQSNMSK